MYSLTVAMPAYNCENTIEKSVRSVQSQTWTGHLEILVCDDGSTDCTYDVLNGLAIHDKRIRILRNDKNSGRPFTRNRLAIETNTDLMTWLDADDEKYPDMIKNQMDKFFLTRQQLGHERFLIYTNYDWDFAEQNEQKIIEPKPTKDPIKALLDGSFGAYLWLTLGKKSTYELAFPFDETLPRLQDLDHFLRLAGSGIEFHRINSKLPQCRYNKEDKGRNSAEVERCFSIIRRKHRFLIELYGDHYMSELYQKHLGVASRFAINNEDLASAQRYVLRKSISRHFRRIRG